ncbi:MAG: universal stress protein [Deltaproteobacteria bacterium]|nr:universal stress protein [Deltaproteobacteria bacterium]
MLEIKKILVPTDLEEPSVAAIRYAISIAREHGAELLVLHVVDEERVMRNAMLPAEEEMLFPRQWSSMGEGSRRFLDIELRDKRLDLYSFLYSHFDVEELKSVSVARLVRRMSEEVGRKAPCPVLTIQPSAVVQDNGHRVPASSLALKDAAASH